MPMTKKTVKKTTAKKTTKTKTTAVSTKTTTKALPAAINNIAGVFDPIEFEKLNASITKLAQSDNLSAEEKGFAMKIIDEWDNSVIAAIDDKIQEGNEIEYSLSLDRGYYNSLDDDILENISKQLGAKTTKLFKEYADTRTYLFNLKKNVPMTNSDRDINETAEEYIDRTAKEDAEYTKYSLKLAKAEKAVNWALYNLKKELNETPEIQELLKRVKSFSRKSNQYKKDCENVCRMAKINVTISDDKIREALKEIIEFKI